MNNIICPAIELVSPETLEHNPGIATNAEARRNISETNNHMTNFSNQYNSFHNDHFQISVNTMKFAKPAVDKPNNFKSEIPPNILSDLKHICAIADGYQSSFEDHNIFMDKAYDEIVQRKKYKSIQKTRRARIDK